MKIRRGGVWAAVLAIAATLLLAAPAQAEEVMEPPAVEVIPDQPEWEYEWRDREYTVVCDGENSARIVIQSMWRPSEPRWDGTEWVTFDDWHEWAWPEAMQTVYKPVEPGDCETVPGEAPASTDGDTDGDPVVLAETGLEVLPLAAVGIGLLAAGIFLAALARRTT